jgi:ABC-type branched-subunit amino acid transport system ATPase component
MALLERVGLAELRLTSVARNLAYGEQRRLEIARALALKPRLLLLDEPAAGMNPQRVARDDRAHPPPCATSWTSPSCSSSTTCRWS